MYNSYERNAQNFIKRFFPYLVEFLTSTKNLYFHSRNVEKVLYTQYKRRVLILHGISRIAFITSNYVIKFDYNSDDDFGNSETEYKFYQIAEREGYSYMFAKISKFTYNGYTFYIMPRVKGINEHRVGAWRYMTDDERDFCDTYELNDLHGGNFGIEHGQLIIFDYASWGG